MATPSTVPNAGQEVTGKGNVPAPKKSVRPPTKTKKEASKKSVEDKRTKPAAASAGSPGQKFAGSGLEVPSAQSLSPAATAPIAGTRGVTANRRIAADKAKTDLLPVPADKGDALTGKAKGT